MDGKREKGGGGSAAVFRIAWNEYVRWLCSPRMVIFLVMILFIQSYVADEMVARSEKMGEPFGVFEIFIAVANSTPLCVVIPAVYLLLIGDFPRRDGNMLLYVYRAGKYKWLLGQLLSSVMEALTYLGALVLCCVLMAAGHCYAMDRWSGVVTRYESMFPEEMDSTVSQLITGRLYNNFTPYQAFGYSASLLFCMFLFVAVLKMLFFFLGRPTAGLSVNVCLLAFGWVFSFLDMGVKWVFPLPHTVEWQHCDEIFRTMPVSMESSYLYFGVLVGVLVFACIVLVDGFNFGDTGQG